MNTFVQKLSTTLDMIKFKHSIFALPFALSSFFLATNGNPELKTLLLIIAAMVTARSAAMTFNRIVDRDIDALNPRTQSRPLASGTLSLKFSVIFCLINSVLFIFISSLFNKLTFILSPFALAILLGYSLTKRFTHITQFFLGIALGISPIAAWIAATGTISLYSLILGLAVCLWVAGFDLIYSCQDYQFDKQNDLKNIVVKLGIQNALRLAKGLHILALTAFLLAGYFHHMGVIYYLGAIFIAAFLVYEHSLVKSHDLSKVDMAFFTLNGYVAILYFIFTLLDIYI